MQLATLTHWHTQGAERTQMEQVRFDFGFPKNSKIKDILHVS